jgi:hypothetical protein
MSDTFDLDISWHENEIKYTIKMNSLNGYTKESIYF